MEKKENLFSLKKSKMLKLYRMIKLFCILLLLGTLQVSASVTSKKNYIKINERNITLAELFWKIQSKTDFVFAFSSEDVEAFSNLDINTEGEIGEILNEILADKGLSFKIKNGVYVIRRKAPSPKPVAIEKQQEEKKIKITGTVRDEKGEPLPFAAVWIKDTAYGCASAIDGSYVLEVPIEEGLILQASSLGYKTVEISVNGRTEIDIVLESDIQGVDEVVVTGFTQISRERSSGAFGKLSDSQLEKASTNIAERLVGTLAGVQLVRDQHGNKRFEIRGQTNLQTQFSKVTGPLIVVDGFPIEGDLQSVNPNDIEDITILKDAAAASIWGSRSGNGVIVITTKRVKKNDDTKVEFNSFWRFSGKFDVAERLNRLNSAEQIELEKFTWETVNEYGQPVYIYSWDLPGYGREDILSQNLSESMVAMNEYRLGNISEDEKNAILNRLAKLDNTKQIQDNLLQNPFTQQYNLSISGSNERLQNRFSLMYEDSKTDMKNTDQQRYMLNYRMNFDLNKSIRFSFGTIFNYNDDNYTGESSRIYHGDSPYEYAVSQAPYQMLKNKDGSLARWANGHYTYEDGFGSGIYQPLFDKYIDKSKFPYEDWTYNPIEELNSREFKQQDIHARIQAGINIKLLKGLDFDSKFQYEIYNEKINERYYENSYEVRMTVNSTTSYDYDNNITDQNIPTGEFLDKANSETISYNIRNQLNFNRTFGKHNISALAGTEFSERESQLWAMPRAFGYDHDRMTTASLPNGDGNESDRYLYGPFVNWRGQPNLINSPYPSRFIPANFIPDLFGFRTTSIPGYTKDVYFSLYSNLAYTFDEKYTLTGSIRTDASNFISADPKYRYSPFWSTGANWQIHKESFLNQVDWLDRLALRVSYGYNGIANKNSTAKTVLNISPAPSPYTGELQSSITRGYGNPNLRWEKIGTFNLGVDYSLWLGRLFGRVEYYNKNSNGLITQVAIPSYMGTSEARLNAVEMRNSGLEIEVGSTLPISGSDIVWTGNFNLSYNKNKITKLYSEPTNPASLIFGPPFAYAEGYNANTVWAQKYAGMSEEGYPQIEDKDGNMHPTTRLFYLDGGPFPYSYNVGVSVAPYLAGFSTNLKFYNFDLSMIISGKFGHKFKRQTFGFSLPTGNQSVSALYKENINGNPDEIVQIPTEGYSEFMTSYFKTDAQSHMDYVVENASHIRFREINLSYRLPQQFVKKLGLNNFKLFGQVNNVGTILFNDSGQDPEFGFYKPRAVYTFGLNCNF